MSNKRLITLLITEEQELSILPLVQGGVAFAMDVDTKTVTMQGVLSKIRFSTIAIVQFILKNGIKDDPNIRSST